MYMYSTSTSYSYMVLPQFNLPIDSTVVSFWLYKTNTTYTHALEVGVMTDPDDVSTFVTVASVAAQNLSTWEPFEVPLNNYTGSGRYIAIKSPDGVYSYPYLDDLTVDRLSTCPRVTNVEAANITTTSATIKWDTTSAFDYEVQYGPSGFTLGNGTTLSVIGVDSVDIFGLSPNTAYDVYVRGICSPDTGNWSYSYTFRTECGRINILPWTENFESFATTSSQTDLPCWAYIGNGSGYNNIATPSGAGNSSSRCYRFMPGSTTPLYAILPPFEQATSGLILTMKVRAESTTSSGTLAIGYVDDSNHFTNVMTVTPTNTDWNNVEVSFPGAPDSARIAIGQYTVSTIYYWWIDDIEVVDVPECARVLDINVDSVLTTSTTISWVDTSSTNSAWWVEYSSTDFVPGAGTVNPILVTDTFYTVTGLDSGTVYYIYVYPDCGDEIAARGITLTTLAASPASVPFSCNFEDAGVNGWDLFSTGQTNYWTVGNATGNPGRGLYVTNNGTSNDYTNTSISYSYAVRNFLLTDTGDYAYSFDWKGNGEGSYDFVRALFVPATENITAGTPLFGTSAYNFGQTVAPAPWIDLTGRTTIPYGLNLQTTWQNCTGIMHISTPGTYKLVFAWVNDGTGGTTPPAAIDNVILVHNTCSMPQNVSATLSEDSISLTWTPGGGESMWEVSLGTTTSVVVTTPAYTFTGLTANTDYTVSIRSICNAGDTSMIYTESFRTSCAAVSLPFSENFDAITTSTTAATGVHIPCWNYVMTGSTTYQGATYQPQIYYSSSNAHSGSYSYRLYGVGYHMLPPMPTSLDSLQLTFWDYTSGSSYGLEVGVMEGNNFVPVQTITTPTSTHVEHTVYFDTYTGTSRIIAFRNYYTTGTTTYYSYHYIDDLEVDYLPTCPPVLDLTPTSNTTSSLTVDWTDMVTPSSWEVQYSGNGTTNTVIATAHPFTITGLTAASSYQVRVRPICSATDTGDWCAPVSMETGCDLINPPYVQNFDGVTGTTYSTAGNLPPCWGGYTNGTSDAYSPHVVSSGSYWYADSANSLIMTSGSESYGDTKIVRLPQFATPVNTLTLSFWMSTESSTNGYLLVGYMTSLDYNSFVTVDSIHASSTTYHGSSSGVSALGINDTVNFASVPSTAQYLAFKWVYTTSFYSCCIDNVVVTSTGSAVCNAPVIDTLFAGETSAVMTWTGSAANYEVAAVAGTWNDPASGTPVAGNTYTFTGLTPGTQYALGVRAVCSEGIYSDWTVNMITTAEHPCLAPTAVNVTGVTINGATIGWTAAEATQTNFQIRYSAAADTTVVDVTTNPYTLTGLLPNTEYSVAVRAVCGEGFYSDWTVAQPFTTASCQPVTGVTVTELTQTTAKVSWTAGSNSNGNYEVAYGIIGTSVQNATRQTVEGSTSYTITGLEEGTGYVVYVRSICAEGVQSDWTSGTTFTTEDEIGIADVDNARISLYPNPASSTVTLTGIEGAATVTVVDMNGREVYSGNTADGRLTIDVSGMSQGAYFVRITGEQVNAIRKLIVR